MPTSDVQTFLDGLDALMTDLRALDPHPSQQSVQSLYQKYRKLHKQSRTLSLKAALRGATTDQREMARFLELGKENYDAFMLALVTHIKPDAEATALAVAEFMKSPAAFRHLRTRLHLDDEDDSVNADQEELDREAVRRIVGSMLGVEVSEKFVLSIRGEMAGKLVTYSLSALCEDDLKAWEDPQTRRKWGNDRDQYLLDCIRHHDMVMAYDMGGHDSSTSTYPIGCVLYAEQDEHRRKPGKQADSCMVNHNRKLIVFGAQTTSTDHDADQAMSAVRMLSALEQMVTQPTLGDPAVPNPYYGYSIVPSFLHAGYFPADRTEGRKVAGQAFLDSLESVGGRLNDEDRHTLARQAFFNVFSESHPNTSLAQTWAKFNVQVCGADTLPLFHDMKAALKDEHPLRRFSEIVLDGTVGALEVLARDDIFVSSKSRGKNVMEPVLNGILATLENHPMNFACVDDAQGRQVGLSTSERIQLGHAAAHLDKLRQKILADNPGDHQKLCSRMAKLAKSIRSGDYQAEFTDPVNLHRPNYQWSNELYNKLAERKENLIIEGQSYLQSIEVSLARAFAERRAHPALVAAVAAAKKDLGAQADFKVELMEEFLDYIQGNRRQLRKLNVNTHPKAYNDFHSTFRRMEEGSISTTLAVSIRTLYSRHAIKALRQGDFSKPYTVTALHHLAVALMEISSKEGGAKVAKALMETARKEQVGLMENTRPNAPRRAKV